jgi:DNA-binding NarL/FixJ family response regulator
MARLAIVDDQETVREGIRLMLSGEEGITIVGEASNGLEALKLCQKTNPTLVLMDVRMPEMDGLAATRTIKRRFPRISVLMLTMYENQDYLLEAIRAGAAGYVLKDAPQQHLVTAIRKALEGEMVLSRTMTNQLLHDLATRYQQALRTSDSQNENLASLLTTRELEVLELLALGLTNREIAEKLFISIGTVKNHVEHIIAKLGVSDRTQAVVRALEVGIISFPKL